MYRSCELIFLQVNTKVPRGHMYQLIFEQAEPVVIGGTKKHTQ